MFRDPIPERYYEYGIASVYAEASPPLPVAASGGLSLGKSLNGS
ncbi:hypothetical protein [Streptomyces sp. STR69]|nr:hypothetical protein [Streptomyces sp. STR69]